MNIILEIPVLYDNDNTEELRNIKGDDYDIPHSEYSVKIVKVYCINTIQPFAKEEDSAYCMLVTGSTKYTVAMSYDSLDYHIAKEISKQRLLFSLMN